MQAQPSELVTALEKIIKDFSQNFLGDGALNFTSEADVQSTLFSRLRENGLFLVQDINSKTDLVHAEFPAFGAPRNDRHDLVIWNPIIAKQAKDKCGPRARRLPMELQKEINLIAVEIKTISGLPWGIRQYQVKAENALDIIYEKMSNHSDIRKLRDSWCQFAYFLIFWDDDVNKKDDLKLFFKYLHESCKKITLNMPKLHIFCISRDKAEFKT